MICTILSTDQEEHMLPRAVLRQSSLAKQLSCVSSARNAQLWLHNNSIAVGSRADPKANFRPKFFSRYPHKEIIADTEGREFGPAY